MLPFLSLSDNVKVKENLLPGCTKTPGADLSIF